MGGAGKVGEVTTSQLVTHFPSTLTLSHFHIDSQYIHRSPQSTAINSVCSLQSFSSYCSVHARGGHC
jgi:hypothetical protein